MFNQKTLINLKLRGKNIMAEEHKQGFVYIAIVAIVAIVALVILISGRGASKEITPITYETSANGGNLGGQAIAQQAYSGETDTYKCSSNGDCGSRWLDCGTSSCNSKNPICLNGKCYYPECCPDKKYT